MASYKEPEWAEAPNDEYRWSLVEIKSGVEVARHALAKPCTILGRASDMVHITLQHESCSRQHARLAFDHSGKLWLRDLKSANGTSVNKRKFPDQAVGKVESNATHTGARGVIVYPGDILQFGFSTRIFCLEGPAEYERGAVSLRKKLSSTESSLSARLAQHDEEATEMVKETQQEEGISWGIEMDTNVENPDKLLESKQRSLPHNLKVPEKHRKAFDRLNAMKYKLSNLNSEDERIRRKVDLTDGQERHLQRNAEREEKLKESILELEQDLYQKLYPDEKQSLSRIRQRRRPIDDNDDTDYFYDRTKERSESVIDSEGESEKSLRSKLTILYARLSSTNDKLIHAQRQQFKLEEDLKLNQNAGTDEIFFIQNDLDIATEAVQKMEDEAARIQNTMLEVEKLLKVANPKLKTDRSTGYIGEARPPKEQNLVLGDQNGENSFGRMLPPPPLRPKHPMDTSIGEPKVPSQGDASLPMPPPAPKAKAASMYDDDNRDSSEPVSRILPPPKRKRVVGPSKLLVAGTDGAVSSSAPQKASRTQLSTLAVLSSFGPKSLNNSSSASLDLANVKRTAQRITDRNKKDEWRAPRDQDGSGMTRLNAKFGGRY